MRLEGELTTGGWLRLLRRFPRVKLETPVAIAWGTKAFLAQAVDVCEGGLGLELPAHLPEGAHISVSFYLPSSPDLLELSATVVHGEQRHDNGLIFCGLQLDAVNDHHRRLLKRYINTRRFLHGDLRAPTDNPDVGKRMTDRLGKVRRLAILT